MVDLAVAAAAVVADRIGRGPEPPSFTAGSPSDQAIMKRPSNSTPEAQDAAAGLAPNLAAIIARNVPASPPAEQSVLLRHPERSATVSARTAALRTACVVAVVWATALSLLPPA